MRLFSNANVDFVGNRHKFVGLSIFLVFVTAVSILLHGGFNLGVDFKGGLLTEARFPNPVKIDEIRKIMNDEKISSFELQSFAKTNSVIITVKGTEESQKAITDKIKDGLGKSEDTKNFSIERTEFVGPSVGKHLVNQAVYAIAFSMLGIIIYVAFRFKSMVWGASGVIALIHDVYITLGLFSILNKEVNLLFITALLTLAGYSISDTIVVFDKIRENLTLLRKEPLDRIINISINKTLSRTIITSLTVFVVLLSLFLFGGTVIHDFSLAMLFGVVIGTYSSIFVASPLVYEWTMHRIAQRKK